MTSSSGVQKQTPAEVDLRDVLARLWRRRWWMVLSVVFFTAALTFVALVSRPKYRATVVMVAASAEKEGMSALSSTLGQLGGLASLAGVRVGGVDMQTQESLAVLESRQFTEAFIRDLNLLPELFFSRWDGSGKRWKKEPPTLAQGFNLFDRSIRAVSRDKDTGLIRLEILWGDPVRGATWANALVERVNAEMRVRAIDRSSASLGYLEKELGATAAVETRQAISRLVESQINERMLANVTREYAFRVVDRALPADSKDIASPNRLLLFVLGPIVGLVFGALLILAIAAIRNESGRPVRPD